MAMTQAGKAREFMDLVENRQPPGKTSSTTSYSAKAYAKNEILGQAGDAGSLNGPRNFSGASRSKQQGAAWQGREGRPAGSGVLCLQTACCFTHYLLRLQQPCRTPETRPPLNQWHWFPFTSSKKDMEDLVYLLGGVQLGVGIAVGFVHNLQVWRLLLLWQSCVFELLAVWIQETLRPRRRRRSLWVGEEREVVGSAGQPFL